MMDELEIFIKEVSDTFREKFYKQVTTRQLFSRVNGWSEERMKTLAKMPDNPAQISELDIDIIGTTYFPYSTLVKFSAFRDTPLTFTYDRINKVKDQPPMSGDYQPEQVSQIKYKTKKSEENIRLLRLEEVLTPTIEIKLLKLLGEANDHRYTELEIMGMIGLMHIINSPERFMTEVWQEIRKSDNGVTLRKRLKVWGLSIKRWPDYWSQRYNCGIEKLIETETVLGYLIEDSLQAYHLELIDKMLADTFVYYDQDYDTFVIDVKRSLKDGFEDGEVHDIPDFTLREYLNNWNNWTTSGSANEYRATVETQDGDTQKLRINKSALPLFTTLEEVLANNDSSAGIVIKAEVGKNRLAYSAPTRVTLVGKYLLDKYDAYGQSAKTTANYISYTSEQRLQLAYKLISLKPQIGMITADIEENDINHNTYLDVLLFYWKFQSVITSPEDRSLLLLFLRDRLMSIVRVNTKQLESVDYIMKSPILKVEGEFTYFYGFAGILSGLPDTYTMNSFVNYSTDRLATLAAIRLVAELEAPPLQPVFDPIVGGDDETVPCTSIRTAALTFEFKSSIYLPVNSEKSYLSYTTCEFFRIMYIRGSRRQGYPSRIIHSIISNNPAKSQEIDIVTSIKAFWSNCSQVHRRGGDLDALKGWCYRYAHAKNIDRRVVSIPTEHGGCGVPLDPSLFSSHVIPGVPRFKMIFRKYQTNKKWFNDIMVQLRVANIPGVSDSYFNDMLTGVRDADARKDSRNTYKEQVAKWKKDFTIVQQRTVPLIPSNLTSSMESIENYWNSQSAPGAVLDAILMAVSQNNEHKDKYYKIRSEYQLFSDILNRGLFRRFKDKINTLTELGLLFVSQNFQNTKSAYVVQSLLNGTLSLSSPVDWSFPADMTFIYQNIGLNVLGPVTIRTPAEFVWFCDYIRYACARGFLPYLSWSTSW